jgi:hypothetical protein
MLATEVGTGRDKKTVDRTTNTINNLLYQVHVMHTWVSFLVC